MLRAFAWPLCLTLIGVIIMIVGLTSCEGDTPNDYMYWRTGCVEMGHDCEARRLDTLGSLFLECRDACKSSTTDTELLENTNSDGGQCLTCSHSEEEEPTLPAAASAHLQRISAASPAP